MTAVLATKLFEPRVPRALVSRPRLVKRFNDGLSARVTLVSAPAGYGKSSLLSEWRASPEGAATRLAWLSVDEADSDPVRFWTHVAAALHHADPDVGVELSESLQRQGPVPLQPKLEELVNELAALGEPLVLVLDDLHAVSSADVLQPLSFLVAHLPPQVRLVIASRTDPPLPLAAMRARGELSELRMPDLQFTRDELDAYFDGLGIVLDIDSLRMLGSRTEGWAAGLHLAALTLADVDDRAAFVRRFAGDDRTVVDYLAEEVLARQPTHVQDFLLATSILERMTGPLCDAVTARSGGQAMLHALEQANLFLVALDNTRTWFRYHHLFAELLRNELRARGTVAENDLRERAARWLADQGLVEEAVPHAVAAGAWDLAIDLGTVHGVTMVVQGLSTTFRQLYGAPPDALRKRPEAALGLAWTAMLGADLDGARRWLEASDVAMTTMDHVPPGPRIDAEILHTVLAERHGEIAASLAGAARVLALLDDHPEVVGIDRDARHGRALLFQARAALLGDQLDVAHDVLTETVAVLREHLPARALVEASGMRGLIALWDGRVDDACRDADAALALEAERRLEGTPHSAWAHLTLGIHHMERLELADAERHLSTALDVVRVHQDVNGVALASAFVADRMRLAGDPLGSAAIVRAALDDRGSDQPVPPLIARLLARADVLARLALGDPGDVASLGATSPTDVRLGSAGPGRQRERIEALATAALASAVEGDDRGAAALVAEAIRFAAPLGWLAPFVELGEPMRTLLTTASPEPHPSLARLRRQILEAFTGRRATDAAASALVEQLSERELTVLRRLPSSLSNQEIAGLLYVSLNTVKTQIQSIYRKLGVNSRHEAIERARQLDLL